MINFLQSLAEYLTTILVTVLAVYYMVAPLLSSIESKLESINQALSKGKRGTVSKKYPTKPLAFVNPLTEAPSKKKDSTQPTKKRSVASKVMQPPAEQSTASSL